MTTLVNRGRQWPRIVSGICDGNKERYCLTWLGTKMFRRPDHRNPSGVMLSRTRENGLGNFCHHKHTSKERHIAAQYNAHPAHDMELPCQCLKTIALHPPSQSPSQHPPNLPYQPPHFPPIKSPPPLPIPNQTRRMKPHPLPTPYPPLPHQTLHIPPPHPPSHHNLHAPFPPRLHHPPQNPPIPPRIPLAPTRQHPRKPTPLHHPHLPLHPLAIPQRCKHKIKRPMQNTDHPPRGFHQRRTSRDVNHHPRSRPREHAKNEPIPPLPVKEARGEELADGRVHRFELGGGVEKVVAGRRGAARADHDADWGAWLGGGGEGGEEGGE